MPNLLFYYQKKNVLIIFSLKKHLCEYFLIMRDNGDITGCMKF